MLFFFNFIFFLTIISTGSVKKSLIKRNIRLAIAAFFFLIFKLLIPLTVASKPFILIIAESSALKQQSSVFMPINSCLTSVVNDIAFILYSLFTLFTCHFI